MKTPGNGENRVTRIGMNPARHRVSDYAPARVTVAMLVYLPHLTGYFQHRFEVVKLSVASLLTNTELDYDLLIFDNGSCEEVKAWLGKLEETGRVRFLFSSSENIGKLNALRLLVGAAPGELIAYTDDDTFFYPGWLSAHVELLDAFPKVGMVSGSPERTLFDHGIQSNLRLAQSDPEVNMSYGKRIPEQWEREWAIALGNDPEDFLQQVHDMEDIIVERRGVSAYATACHNQFLSPKSIMQIFLEGKWSGRLMGGLNELDNAIDEDGYLRLTTIDRTTRLIGNVVSPEMIQEAKRFKIPVRGRIWQTSPAQRGGLGAAVVKWRPIHWLLQGIYNRLFWLLTGQRGTWLDVGQGEEHTEE